MKEKLIFIIKKYFIPYFVLLTIFMLVSYVVIHVRMISIETNFMPDIVGKYFINVYNDLKKYNLNIYIKKVYIPEKPEGIILEQSILPGEIIKPKDRLVLKVNGYEPILTMPDVTNITLNNAIKNLSSLSYEDEIYSLNVSKILYVYNPQIEENMVLYQFPSPNTKVKINEKVILIVSTKKELPIEIKELKDMNIGIVSQYLVLQNKTYFIKEVVYTNKRDLHGIVKEILPSDYIYELSVYFNKNKKYTFYSDFEQDKIKFSREEECSVYLSSNKSSNLEDIIISQKLWFSKPKIFSEKKMPFIFYRSGENYLYLICNNKIIEIKHFKPDYLL